MKIKPWYTSLTVWSNILIAVLAAVDALSAANLLRPQAYIYITVGVNLLLRIFKTDSKLD
jgi:hypothetical protein